MDGKREKTTMLIDSHCHLSAEELLADLPEIIAQAKSQNVRYLLNAGGKVDALETQLEICRRFPNVFTVTGVHPHDAKIYAAITAEEVLKNTAYPQVVAIGECGLDYFYDFCPKDVQIQVFKQMISASQQSELPLIVHTRQADEDTIALLQDAYKMKPFKGVIHCFSAGWAVAKAALEMGFYISASGMITFKNNGNLRELFAQIPLERLLIETDSPYLAPVPLRGKTNQPAYIVHTAECLAAIKGVDLNQISAITSENFFKLFSKAKNRADKRT